MSTPAAIFRAHPLAPEPGQLIVPDWRQVDKIIPLDFANDGSSDPTILYVLAVFSFIPWCKRTMQIINDAGERHDFGYGPGRLPGSGYEYITREGWDAMYAQNIADLGRPRIAKWHKRGVNRMGQSAWDRWTETMARWGWHTFSDFLADRDHKFGFGAATHPKDKVQ